MSLKKPFCSLCFLPRWSKITFLSVFLIGPRWRICFLSPTNPPAKIFKTYFFFQGIPSSTTLWWSPTPPPTRSTPPPSCTGSTSCCGGGRGGRSWTAGEGEGSCFKNKTGYPPLFRARTLLLPLIVCFVSFLKILWSLKQKSSFPAKIIPPFDHFLTLKLGNHFCCTFLNSKSPKRTFPHCDSIVFCHQNSNLTFPNVQTPFFPRFHENGTKERGGLHDRLQLYNVFRI